MLVVLRVNDPPFQWRIFLSLQLYYGHHLLRRTLHRLIINSANQGRFVFNSYHVYS